MVRETAAGRLLLVDGSHASLLPSGRAFTASIWDLLAATVLLLPPALARPRVLLLGLGGGSVLRLIRALVPTAELHAVELSAEVVEVARRDFALDALRARVHVDDAARFLTRASNRGRYDLVIDDVYAGKVGAMHKPARWREVLGAAWARVDERGLLAMNALNARDERLVDALGCPQCLRVEHAQYHNRILVLAKGHTLSARGLRQRWRASPELASVLRHTRIRTRYF